MNNKVFYIVLFLSFLSLGGLIFLMSSEGGHCTANPYVYGAKKMGGVECSCFQEQGQCDPKFSFNASGFFPILTKCDIQQIYYNVDNLSKFNLTLE